MANGFLHFVFNFRKHREEVKGKRRLREILFPSFSWKFIVRLMVVIVVAYGFFRFVCSPKLISGDSMDPTYHDRGFTFCFRLGYLFSDPQRGDVAMIRLAGPKVMYLKRIVAVAGDTVEFRNGKLLVNGKIVEEPYVKFQSRWNLLPRKVKRSEERRVGKECRSRWSPDQ